VCVCLGEYVFTVDCRGDNVDIIFTENETNSLRRHVLQKRQLKNDKLCECKVVAGKDDSLAASCSEPADVSCTAHTSTSANAAGAAATTHTAAAADDAVTVRCPLVTVDSDSDTVTSDTDDSTDEDSNTVSDSQSHAMTAHYTKDAFHKYLISG